MLVLTKALIHLHSCTDALCLPTCNCIQDAGEVPDRPLPPCHTSFHTSLRGSWNVCGGMGACCRKSELCRCAITCIWL